MVAGGALIGSDTGGVTVNIKPSSGFIPAQSYTLIDWHQASATGVESSDFVLSLPAGYTGTLEVVGSRLQATVVPEPGAVVLLGLGMLALLFRPCARQFKRQRCN
jgi:hypothetical protein